MVIQACDLATTLNTKSKDFTFIINSALRLESVLNFPNPMQNDTRFTYILFNDKSVDVSIKIFTIAGRLIKVIDIPNVEVGYNETFWNGRDENFDEIANGVYFYKIIAKDGTKRTEVIEKLVKMR